MQLQQNDKQLSKIDENQFHKIFQTPNPQLIFQALLNQNQMLN